MNPGRRVEFRHGHCLLLRATPPRPPHSRAVSEENSERRPRVVRYMKQRGWPALGR